MANTKLIDYLRLLIPHSEESVQLLGTYFENRILKKGDAVLKEGEVCLGFYFVEQGHLRTFYHKDGSEINMHFHFEGSITSGDHRSAKAGIPSEFSIVAGEPSEIWILNRKKLIELCYANPDIMIFGRRLLSFILLDLNAHHQLLRIHSPAEHYRYIEQHNPRLLQRISLSHLSSYLAVNRRTLTRIRGKK